MHICARCGWNKHERRAQPLEADRAVVYYNPLTGEHRTPGRNDMPMPEVYARQGYERKEIMSMTSWEKQSGAVHEDSNFNAGNAMDSLLAQEAPPAKKDPAITEALVKALQG